MIKRISLLVVAALLAATMMVATAVPALAQEVCTKERGTITCTTTTEGKNPKFEQQTTTTKKGSPQSSHPEEPGPTTCTEPCPPGQFK